ncbi:MAG: hypothetical protein WCP20_11460 [Desulfuromonadales bacterium]
MTTIQPIKNDQAVTLVVKSHAALNSSTLAAPQSPQVQHSPSGVDKNVKADIATGKDVFFDTQSAPAKSATGRLTVLQNSSDTRSLQANAVNTSKAVEEQMESMKQKMDEIVNSYPPFLRGSEKRQQYLMSISSIRQQIEAMTIPPDKLINQASGNEVNKMWTSLFRNVDIPALSSNGPNEATDAQIKAASAAVGAMQSDLSGRRAALEQQVTATPPVISSPMAQYISQAAGQELAQTGLSLTTNLTGALKGL